MAIISQKEAAKRFAKKWEGQGREKQDDSKFWLDLLQNVFRVSDPYSLIEFQKPVKMESSTRFIDAFIPETRVLIEQKGVGEDLSKKHLQSGGDMLTPYEQARRYDQWMLPDEHPLWIVACNFKSFEIHDMRHPFDAPEVVLLENLVDEYTRLSFITDADRLHIQREQKVSMDAGKIVGSIYDALQKQYIKPDDDATKHSLNVLCVRLVFCLYAEDAGIFCKDQFHDYLKDVPAEDMREAILKLFEVLDTPEGERSPYLKGSLKAFPYTNGGLFHDRDIEVPMFTDEIKEVLVEHASDDFDWSAISPTIFGGVFESTLNPETRRKGGMHYTSIENIHKVIDPLFLDDLKEELQNLKDERPIPTSKKIPEWRRKMVAFQEKLAGLKFLDPACGSGNFLTETYLSLRRLENDIIRELNDGNMNLGFDEGIIKVQISQFYGIEINDFASDVARTALWISEAQMMEETKNIIQRDMDFLPLKSNSNIHTGNALRMDWNEVVPASELNYIMGNPPFLGYSIQNESQKEDMLSVLVDEKGKPYKTAGKVDYVSAWYFKSAAMMQENPAIRAALVSTNSITQGEQVSGIWEPLMNRYRMHIDFAWRTFIWDSEANQKAHVHCVIVGFSIGFPKERPRLFDGNGETKASHINGYLIDAPNVFIGNRSTPLCDVPSMTTGNRPADGGNLIIEEKDYDVFLAAEPEALRYIKKLVGSEEFINNKKRYCLWLVGVSPAELRKMPKVMERVAACREDRLSAPDPGRRKLADRPMLFRETKNPSTYIIVPAVSSERRLYVPMGFLTDDTIPTNLVTIIPEASFYHFGVLESSVHMAWMRAVAGRLEMRYRYSKDIVYNNFPWPTPSEAQKARIEEAAQSILDARALYPDSSLADLYDDLAMPPELRKAHRANDAAVMEAYGFRKDMTEPEIVAELFRMYQALVQE